MKSYTSLEQSKKLVGILPLESADMCYNWFVIGKEYSNIPQCRKFIDDELPCWSLAALLDVLPPYLFEFDRGIDLNIYPHLNGRRWHCSYMPNCIENMITDKFKLITSGDTLVDACVDMIEKLHEQKLL